MNGRTLLCIALLLLFFLGCVHTTKNNESSSDNEQQELNDSVSRQSSAFDTIKTTYPIQIGNDKGLVSVQEIRGNEPDHFFIDLDYRNEKVFSVYVDKNVLLDSAMTPRFLDTLHMDYTDGAILTNVKYKAIRGSTLYFSAIMENQEKQKKLEGRFNVFYDPSRKGRLYGWGTDTLYDHLSNK